MLFINTYPKLFPKITLKKKKKTENEIIVYYLKSWAVTKNLSDRSR